MLAERKEAYEKSGKTLSYVAQANSFPARKAAIPVLQSVHSQVLQGYATQLVRAGVQVRTLVSPYIHAKLIVTA